MKQKWQLRDPDWTARKKRYWASHDRVCVKCGFGTDAIATAYEHELHGLAVEALK